MFNNTLCFPCIYEIFPHGRYFIELIMVRTKHGVFKLYLGNTSLHPIVFPLKNVLKMWEALEGSRMLLWINFETDTSSYNREEFTFIPIKLPLLCFLIDPNTYHRLFSIFSLWKHSLYELLVCSYVSHFTNLFILSEHFDDFLNFTVIYDEALLWNLSPFIIFWLYTRRIDHILLNLWSACSLGQTRWVFLIRCHIMHRYPLGRVLARDTTRSVKF